jgi:hypothetical protein
MILVLKKTIFSIIEKNGFQEKQLVSWLFTRFTNQHIKI